MNEGQDPNRTVDDAPVPADSLDAGLAAGFGRAEPPRASLGALRPVLLKEAEGEGAHVVKAKSDAMPPPEQTGDRYQLQGEIARGGMGAVLRGRDVDLGRDLAVKVLLEKHVHRPEVARRFIEEAQIGGQLQHPGVVPVYDIGRFGDRPFFTMKLVKGQTLAALLSERTSASPVALAPGELGALTQPRSPSDLPRFLAIALQVAQTIAYAHAKGVIHRDLKPANIMVGAFGEVQVMDWGLAKVLVEGGIADEVRASRERQRPEDVTTIRTARSTGSGVGTDTEAGSLLGTPAYMPPEQANGDVANLDRRADVFGLGAILCEILTGKPPYVGRSAEEVRRKSCNGDLADALGRLDVCGADTEVIALTRQCLAPEAIDRPKDAQTVAERLTAYQSGVQERLHQAELAEAEAKAKAMEEAKRRRLTLALAGTVMLALTLGGGGYLYVKNERDARQAQVAREVNDALNQATALRAQASSATTGGAVLFAQAREQVQRALALVEGGPADDTLKAQVRQLQTELDEEEKDRQLVAALDEARLAQAELSDDRRGMGKWELALPKFREAFRAYGLPAGEGEPAAAAERIRQRSAAVREAIIAALDEWDRLAGIPKLGVREPYRDWLRAVLEAAEPAEGWTRRFRLAREEKDEARRRAALEKLAEADNVEKLPVRALFSLAAYLATVDAHASAVRLLRQAKQQYPADYWVNYLLGFELLNVTPPEWDEAVRFLTAAVALRPESPGSHYILVRVLKRKGQLDEAIACYNKAVALDPKYAFAHNSLGLALAAKGQVDEAIACYKKAIALDPKYAAAHSNLGNALAGKGQSDAAIACFRKAIAVDPKDASTHNNLGLVLADKGQVDEAIACYNKAIASDPKQAKARFNLGNALLRKGQVDEAIASYRKAIELDPKYVKAHGGLGIALYYKGQLDAAIFCYKKAIELDPKLALAHNGLGNALKDKGQLDEAIASYHKAIALDPKLAFAHNGLGVALGTKGQVDEAIACFRKAIELDPKYALAHDNLGQALRTKGQLDAAIFCYKKAIELDPKYAQARANLAQAERLAAVRDKFAAFRNGSYTPASNAERLGLAEWCQVKKLNHTATRLYAAAFAADPKLADDLKAGHRYNAACYAALAAAGQGEDAAKLDDKERALLRRQARDWLRADLTLRGKQLESGKAADRTAAKQVLQHWQKDTDLVSLRDAQALAKLPAEERAACETLWADVAALLKKAER